MSITINVYRVNEFDWVYAESLESAAAFYKEYTGEEIDYEEAYRLDDSQLDRMMYTATDWEFGFKEPEVITFRKALELKLKLGDEPPFLFASTEQ